MDSNTTKRENTIQQFDEKIHELQELNKILVDRSLTPPSGKKYAGICKFFYQTLMDWVKENQPCFLINEYCFKSDKKPDVNYASLYETLIVSMQLADRVQLDAEEYTNGVIKAFTTLVPFLSRYEILDTSTKLASMFLDTPVHVKTALLDIITNYLLPLIFNFMTENVEDELAEINLHAPALIATVLDSTNEQVHWDKIMECLMRYKKNVLDDLLTVLAYGTKESLRGSIYLLNRYFPPVDIGTLKDTQDANLVVPSNHFCQSPTCRSREPKIEAFKVCQIFVPDKSNLSGKHHKPRLPG